MKPSSDRPARGLVLGKFLPPHRGHQFLIEFARQYVEHLTVLVGALRSEPIPGKLRHQWVREMFPQANVNVVYLPEDLPSTPADHPDFWPIWRQAIYDAAPEGIDCFFASEDYGPKTAEVIGNGCRYVEVDQPRELVPISGTLVRNDPMRYWDFLPEPVRPYFLKRVCIFGPESTGKSTLARDLAREFQTLHAWEFARPLLDRQNGKCFAHNIPDIVRGQIATEDALARQARRVLFCDTDVLTTTLWSDTLFGDTPAWIRQFADGRTYDLYLLLDVDVPWVNDGQRFFEDQHMRQQIFERFRNALESRQRKYQIIRGDWATRFRTARDAVKRLLESAQQQ